MNKEFKETKSTDVAQRNSNWNPVDKDGRVHDRWHHGANPTRITWLGEDGLSYFVEGRMVYQTVIGDKKGQEVLAMLARDHEELDNSFFNSLRLQDYGYQNSVEAFEANLSEGEVHPEELLVDPDQLSVHEMAFPEDRKLSKREILTKDWHRALNETTAGNPEKLSLYKRRYEDGLEVGELAEEQFMSSGKMISNQGMSDRLMKIVKKTYRCLTGEEMPKLRDR